MVELISEKFLNDETNIYARFIYEVSILKELRRRAFRLATIYSLDKYYSDLLIRFIHLIEDNIDFVYLLENYFSNALPVKNNLKLGIKRNNEVEKFGDLIHNLDFSNANQMMALDNLSIDVLYKKEILKVSDFTLHRRSRLIYDLRSTSTLYYDIVLPFHDKNYVPTSTDCTSRLDLPSFFRDR